MFTALKEPFGTDPNALIQLTKVAMKDYSDADNIKKMVTDEVAKNPDYAKTLAKHLEEIETANIT